MSEYIIDIKNISKKFGNKEVLKNLDLIIPKGSVFGLLGINGAGKTTLIKSVLGLLKVSSGNIEVLGDNPWDFQDVTKEKLGYVPQSDRVYPWLTVNQLIAYTASFYKHWNKDLVNKLIKEWQVDINAKMGVLSEGEAQKVSIILALGHEPELLVLDEPVASLDPAARRQFIKTILDVVAERGCTVFFSTHITSDLERVADHVAVVKNGAVNFCGELDDLKDEVKRLRVFFKDAFPKDFNMDGFIHHESLGHEAVISVRGFNEEKRKYIENTFKATVEVENLNLEEIFLELSRC